MDDKKLRQLLFQYLNNSINPADCVELLNYLNHNPEKVAETLNDHNIDINDGSDFDNIQANQVFQRIITDSRFTGTADEPPTPKFGSIIRLIQKPWFSVAALVIAGCFITLLKTHQSPVIVKNKVAVNKSQPVIVPGSNKAVLRLANNQVIVLSNSKNGVLARSGSLNVRKVNDGKLVYQANKIADATSTSAQQSHLNTLIVPNGGQYQVVLEDGTKVWLNSASSLTYPDAFTGADRQVKLTGEAYFEVAKNPDKPFYVNVNNEQIRVLGTHFNIAAYDNDDDITTTLLEGSVRVTKNNTTVMLKPGQQSVSMNNSDRIRVADADIDEVMAWKHGYFIFNDENIQDIMKRVSRWYDVDIAYDGAVKDQQFGGTYDRSKSITELTKYLEKLGKVHFKIEGRRIIVMK
jgi:transmembrane sensor